MDEITAKLESIQNAINQLSIRGREARQILNYVDNTCEEIKAALVAPEPEDPDTAQTARTWPLGEV